MKSRNLIEVLVAIASIFIFPKDFFISTIGLHTEIFGILILVAVGAYVWFVSGSINLPPFSLGVSVLVIVSWLGSVLANTIIKSDIIINTSSYYASFFLALIILIIKPKKIRIWMTLLMGFNIILQVFEAFSGEFIYSYVDDDYVYDEKMLSTDDGALRVKGLWGSPLNAIGISMSLALMDPKSPILWVMLCLSSALGQGRLGLGVGLMGLLMMVFSDKSRSRKPEQLKKFYFLLFGIFSIVLVVLFFGTDGSVQRLLEAGSSENSQNISRLVFWGQSINEILNLNFVGHLFGKFGYIKALQGGTESDWLRIWLDNGIICLVAYLFLAFYRLYDSIRKKDLMEFYAVLVTIFVMAVYPHAQSMPNGILVWLFLLGGWPRGRVINK